MNYRPVKISKRLPDDGWIGFTDVGEAEYWKAAKEWRDPNSRYTVVVPSIWLEPVEPIDEGKIEEIILDKTWILSPQGATDKIHSIKRSTIKKAAKAIASLVKEIE